jgi:hypothetical protein
MLSPSMQKWPAHRRLLPTLTAQDYGSTNNGSRDGQSSYATAGTPSLETMARAGKPSPTRVEWALVPTLLTNMGSYNQKYGERILTLLGMAQNGTLLPTLTKSEAKRGNQQHYARGNPTLTMPTLTARDSKGPGPKHTQGGDDLPTKAGGHLSPTFCEWFMGYPAGWVVVKDAPDGKSSGSATRSSRTKRKSSASSSKNSKKRKR